MCCVLKLIPENSFEIGGNEQEVLLPHDLFCEQNIGGDNLV